MQELKKGLDFSVIFQEIQRNTKSVEEQEAAEKREAEERKQQRYVSKVPQRYWKSTIDTFTTETKKQHQAADCVRRYITAVKRGEGSSLALIGPAGTGKTHLACAVIREVGGEYLMSSQLCEKFRRVQSFSEKMTEEDLLEKYGRIDFLAIDEIGRGADSTKEQYSLYQIINARYNAKKPTLLISNYNHTDFLNFLGEAINDRLVENGFIFDFSGEKSYRAILRNDK